MTRAIADTSVFIAQESGRALGELPDELAVSVVTAAELELGVLRARDDGSRARRLATLIRVRETFSLLPVDDAVASRFAQLAAREIGAGRKPRRHDTWIAATALRHGVSVVTQDREFSEYGPVVAVLWV